MNNPWTAARSRVHKRGKDWISETTDSAGKVVLYDVGPYDAIARNARRDAATVRRLEGAGHIIQYSAGAIYRAYPKYPGDKNA